MSATTRVYVVTDTSTEPPTEQLVRATSQAQAIARVTTPRFSAEVADQDTCLRLASNGVLDETKGEPKPKE